MITATVLWKNIVSQVALSVNLLPLISAAGGRNRIVVLPQLLVAVVIRKRHRLLFELIDIDLLDQDIRSVSSDASKKTEPKQLTEKVMDAGSEALPVRSVAETERT